MHLLAVTTKKDIFSTWLLLIFTLTLLATAAYTKYFHIPGAQDHNLERIRILFNANDLEGVKQIELKNRLGTFKAEKFISGKMGPHWLLTSPRRLFANERTISQIFKILEDIRIKKVYPNDPINLANFSLNTPNIELSLVDKSGASLKVSIGLINPIDNSTYLLSSDSDAIFHIQALPSIIEKLNFSDFVESNMLTVPFEQITKIKLKKGDHYAAQLDLVTDKELEWSTRDGRMLDKDSIQSYYNELAGQQSHMILDVTSDEQAQQIQELLKRPLYTISFTDKNGKHLSLKVSNLIGTLPGLKIEKRKYVLIQSSNKDYPYIYNKDILKYFYKTQYSFKRRARH